MTETLDPVPLFERYKTACELKQKVDWPAITQAIEAFCLCAFGRPMKVRRVDSWEKLRDARAAWAAWAAWDAWDARDARAARAAWDARAAWAAWAAWASRAAWAARDARAAWDLTYVAAVLFGAIEARQANLARDCFLILKAVEAGAWAAFFEQNQVWVAPIPEVLKVDSRRRLHSLDGPAYKSLDVSEFYFRGVRVPGWVIETPEEITWARVMGEGNAEVRRVMTELYPGGVMALMADAGARRIARDRFAEVWQEPAQNVVCARVVCPSTGREYWIRVDPDAYGGDVCRSGQAAVASTWRRKDGSMVFADWRDYEPVVET